MLLNGGSPTFRMTVEGPPRDIQAALQDEVYRIGREILRETLSATRALKRLRSKIRYVSQELRIRLGVDGIGIDPNVSQRGRAGGTLLGLPGIRERAKKRWRALNWIFGGEAGAGTEVQSDRTGISRIRKNPKPVYSDSFRKKARSHDE